MFNTSQQQHLTSQQQPGANASSQPAVGGKRGALRVCPHCQKTFTSVGGFRIHVNIHKGIYPYTCSYCQKGCTTDRVLKEHLTTHTNIYYFTCSVCSEAFPTEYKMKIHVNKEHGKGEEK